MLSLANRARAGRARVPARHRARPLRDPARDRRASGPSGAVVGGSRTRTQGRDDVARTDITLVGSDPSYSEIVAYSDRAVGRRDGRLAEPRRCDETATRRPRRDRRHSQLHRLHAAQAATGPAAAAALRGERRHEDRDSRLELQAGQTYRFRDGRSSRGSAERVSCATPPGWRRPGAEHGLPARHASWASRIVRTRTRRAGSW